MSVSGVSASSSAYTPSIPSSARRTKEAEQAFFVPASALRSENARQAQAPRDPAADSAEIGAGYLQLLAGQSYAPPPVQPLQEATEQLPDQSLPAGIPGDPGAAPGEEPSGETAGSEGADETESADPDEKKANGEELSEEEQVQVQELASRDREVRAHEQAHQAVGGQYAGGASYEYQMGPDGKRYAVGGEVSIDASAEREPESTIAKMQVVQAAAMAPAQPSGQDRSVAAQAAATAAEAQGQLREQQAEAAASEGGAGEAGGAEGREGAGETESAQGANSDAGAGTAGESSNPLVEAFRRSRSNPYGNAPGTLNLPEAYRSINVVA